MKILYLGNKLALKGQTPTTIDTLGEQFKEFSETITASDKKNKILRLIDMCVHVIRYRKVDFVVIDTYSTSAFYFVLFVAFLCKLLKIKYIPILHGGDLGSRLDKSPKLSKFIFGNAYHLVSPSSYLSNEFKLRGYNNVKIIPNNINISNYKFKHRATIRPKILWVRAFAEIYNCQMAIEVLNKLLSIYPSASLCMVGPDRDGTFEKIKKMVVDYGISDHVKFTGKISKKEWHNLSEEYDIFISTTNYDNTPVSVIEAMALGLPCVLTNVGGVSYLVENGEDAILVDKDNSNQMLNSIQNIIENPEIAKKISTNSRIKAESFDWEICKKKWIGLLRKTPNMGAKS